MTQKLLHLSGIVALAAVAFAFVEVGLAVRQEAGRLDSTLTDISRLTQSTVGVTADLRKIADSVRKQADAQAAALTEGAQNLARTTVALNSDLGRIGVAIDHLDAAVVAQNANLTVLERQATATVGELQSSIAEFAPAARAATATLQNTANLTGNPNLAETMRQIEETTGHLNSTAASADRDAQMLEARLRQALKPASMAKTIFERLLGIAGPLAQVATAAK